MANLKDLLTQKSVNLSLNLALIYGKNYRRKKKFSQNGYERIFIKSTNLCQYFLSKVKVILAIGKEHNIGIGYYKSQKADIDSNQSVFFLIAKDMMINSIQN